MSDETRANGNAGGFSDEPTAWGASSDAATNVTPSPGSYPASPSGQGYGDMNTQTGAAYQSADGYGSGSATDTGQYGTPISPAGQNSHRPFYADHPESHSGSDAYASRMPKPKKNGTPPLLAIATVLTAAAVAVCLVIFFMQKGSDGSSSAGPPTVASQPAPSSSEASSSSSSSVTSETYADFPSGESSTVCSGDQTVASDDVRTFAAYTDQSCGFTSAMRDSVLNFLQTSPKAENFTRTVYSESAKRSYVFNCSRTNHLTTCTAPGRSNQTVGGYIKDQAK